MDATRWLPLALVVTMAGCGTDGTSNPAQTPGDTDAASPPNDASKPDVTAADVAVSEDAPQPTGGQDAPVAADAPSDAITPAADASATPDAGSPDVGAPPAHINVLAFGDGDPDQHGPYVDAALMWLDQQKADGSLSYTFIEGAPDTFSDSLLAQYDVIYQVNYPPFTWSDAAEAAFQNYLTNGVGGWVGVHHSSLYGPEVTPNGEVPWTWFDDTLLGSINFVDYIATFAAGTVHVEDTTHPIMNGVPSTFLVTKEEWYTWDKSPRLSPNVHVIANVDESSYMPPSDKKMGDHPVIWTNPNLKGKNVYIFMGHDPVLFQSTEYKTLLRNALFWAATK